jgi:hypothetical protein
MRSNHIDMRSHKRPRNKSGGQVVKIKISAKEDLVEDVRAVYGDYTAEQMKRSAITCGSLRKIPASFSTSFCLGLDRMNLRQP